MADDGDGVLPIGVPRQASAGESEVWWHLTNLPRDVHSAEVVAQLHVLRWQIELLWKQLKSYFRIDKMPVLSEHNVTMLMQLAILTYRLTLHVCPVKAIRRLTASAKILEYGKYTPVFACRGARRMASPSHTTP